MKLFHLLLVAVLPDVDVKLTCCDLSNFKCGVLYLGRVVLFTFREVKLLYRRVVLPDGDVQLTRRDIDFQCS